MVDRRRSGRRSKQRGNSFESEIAKKFSAWSGKEFNRTPASGSLHWGDNNQFKVDGDVITSDPKWPYLIECKRYDSTPLGIEPLMSHNTPFPSFVAQSVREGTHTKCPWMLVFRRNRIHGFVLMPYDEKLTRLFNTYMVTTIPYKSEETNLKESIKTITFPIDDMLDLSYNKMIHVYSSPLIWQKQITQIEKKKVTENSIDELVDKVGKLGL